MKYILPGMGASSKMYFGPWHELKDCRFIDWPPYNGEKSIHDLAVRLIEKYRMSQSDLLIGSSLGGMVALEISEVLGSSKVFLIGSAINPREISLLSKTGMQLTGRSLVRASQFICSFSKNNKVY